MIIEFSMIESLIIEFSVTLDLSLISDLDIVELATWEFSIVAFSSVDPVAVEFSIIKLVVLESVIFEKVLVQEVRERLIDVINKTKRMFFIFCSNGYDKEEVCEDRFFVPALTAKSFN